MWPKPMKSPMEIRNGPVKENVRLSMSSPLYHLNQNSLYDRLHLNSKACTSSNSGQLKILS